MLWLSLAFADVLIPAPEGEVYVTHSVRIEGVGPDVVLVAFDGEPGSTIESHRVFTNERVENTVARGGSRGAQLSAPKVYVMAKEDFDAWDAVRAADVAKQEEACLNGEGCAHISRFVPRYAAPTKVVSCDTQLDLVYTAPEGSPIERLDTFSVDATATACTLTAKDAKPPAKSADPTPDAAESADCSTATGPVSVMLAVVLLLLARR